MHATSVERRPSGKKKAPLAKRASVDDIATYSVDVPDGEVQRNYIIAYMYAVDLCKYFIKPGTRRPLASTHLVS